MSQKKFKLGFIGCGHMGMSIAKGALSASILPSDQICVYDPNEHVYHACNQLGMHYCLKPEEVAENAEIVLLAVTPQVMDKALEPLKGYDIPCVLTIAAAISINHIQSILGQDIPVVRVMPNTPLMVGVGATAICHSEQVKDEHLSFVKDLFQALGVVAEIDESQMEDVIAVNGSTPAYFYYFLNCILKDAVNRGMDEKAARTLLVQTMIGSGKLLEAEPDKPVNEFVDAVCSKGGTTIEAIEYFRNHNVEELVKEADEACIKRAKELKR